MEIVSQCGLQYKEAISMSQKLSKEEKKALARKALDDRAKHPTKKDGSGFARLDADAKKLQR